MTHNPHLPTLEEVMNGSPFDIVDSPWGHVERWRASTMATGTMGALANVYDLVRSDAASQAARADAEQARNVLIGHVCDQITELARRFDNLEARLAEAEDKRRADQEREAEFEAEPLTLPPDIAEYQTRTPPSSLEDADTHEPTGDLHTVAPKSEPPDPELEVEDDNVGDLPPELAEPPDPVPEPRGSVYPQPTAISLNKE